MKTAIHRNFSYKKINTSKLEVSPNVLINVKIARGMEIDIFKLSKVDWR